MSMLLLSVLCIFYVLVQAHTLDNFKQIIQYSNLVPINNHTNYLNKGSKINFNDYLNTDPLFKNVFDVEKVLQDSEIFFLCDKNIPDLTKTVELNLVKKYPGVLLCMGLSHVLLLNGVMLAQQQNSLNSIILPKTKSDLDTLISNMNDNSSLKHEVMCKQHKVTLPTYHSDVEEYVKMLNPLLDNEDMCLKMCLTYQDTINPICALIMEANSAFYNLLKQSHVNSTKQAENVDSVNAVEVKSGIDTTVPNTKEITDDLRESVPINKGNVAAVLSKDNSTAVTNDTSSVTHVITVSVEPVVTNKHNNTDTPTPIIPKLDPDVGENVNDENSAENTDNVDDYNVETAKQTSPSDAPVVTQLKTKPATNVTSSPQPNSKPVLVEEDNAEEAAEVDPANSNQKEIIGEESNKPVDATKKKSTTKKVPTSPKTSEKTAVESKDEFEMSDNLDVVPPPLQDPPVPNVETMEGDHILLNVNNNAPANMDEEETFSSNIDQKQQAADPGDSGLDIQENTPYIITKDGFVEAEDSHFFTYFVLMFVICIVMYVGFYNKRKILALALEGRAGRRTRSRRGTYSRVNTGYDESKEHLLY